VRNRNRASTVEPVTFPTRCQSRDVPVRRAVRDRRIRASSPMTMCGFDVGPLDRIGCGVVVAGIRRHQRFRLQMPTRRTRPLPDPAFRVSGGDFMTAHPHGAAAGASLVSRGRIEGAS
jgi:hypothetical protein